MPSFPGPLAALALLVLGMLTAVLAFVAGSALHVPPFPLLLLSSLAGTGTALLTGRAAAGRSGRRILRLDGHDRRGWAPLLPLLAGAVVVVSELENLFRTVWPPPASFMETMQEILAPEHPVERALAFVLAGLCAPLLEELLFRGLILGGLSNRYGGARGIALSALLFGIYHLYPWQALPALALGLLFGWVTWRSGAIGYAVALHAGNNLLALALAGLAADVSGLTQRGPEVVHVPPAALAAGAVLLVWGVKRFAAVFPRPANP